MIKIGGTEIVDIAVGSTPIEKAYIGSQLVWEKGVSAKDYIQNGLVAMWDGIENVGWGQHSDNAMAWVDLKGTTNYNFILQNNPTWDSDGLITSSDYSRVAETAASIPYASNLTTEVVFEIYAIPSTTRIGLLKLGNSQLNGSTNWLMRGLLFSVSKTGWMFKSHSIMSNTGYSTPPLNTPMSIAVVYTVPSGSTDNKVRQNPSRVLIDGVAKSPSWAVDGCAYGDQMWISYNSTAGFYGKVYAIRVYNRQLSNAEIEQNYLLDKKRFGI